MRRALYVKEMLVSWWGARVLWSGRGIRQAVEVLKNVVRTNKTVKTV